MQRSIGTIAVQAVAIILLLVLAMNHPLALASVHQYPEGEQQVMWRSLQTLRDQSDRAWQLVLFKRIDQSISSAIHLRLVGFPGAVELAHPQPLAVITRTDKIWQAREITSGAPSSSSVGEYELTDLLSALDSNAPLRLRLPTATQTIEIRVPPFVVQEWRQISQQT